MSASGDQLRQLALDGSLDLAAVLAELGLDVGQADRLIDLLFGAAADAPLAAEDAVFVDLQALGLANLADRDVVALRAGEVVQRGAIALLRARRAGRPGCPP